LNSPPSSFFFIAPSLFSGIVSMGIIFPFTYCVHSIYTIFTFLHHIPTSYPLPLEPTHLVRTCSSLLFSYFVKERKKYIVLLVFV
jgi:hypothetical protein